MDTFIRKYAGRLAGVCVGGLTGFLVQLGLDLSPEALQGLQQFVTELVVMGSLLGYSAAHSWITHRGENK